MGIRSTHVVRTTCYHRQLAMLRTWGKPSAGVNQLRGRTTSRVPAMGALPNSYPGYQAVTNPEIRAKFEKAWGRRLPDKVGLTVTEAVNAAHEGKLKAIYIMGENPMVSDPDINHVREALENLEFLVVQDIFMTETLRRRRGAARPVSLPKTDLHQHRGAHLRPAVKAPGEARSDWKIICDIASRWYE